MWQQDNPELLGGVVDRLSLPFSSPKSVKIIRCACWVSPLLLLFCWGTAQSQGTGLCWWLVCTAFSSQLWHLREYGPHWQWMEERPNDKYVQKRSVPPHVSPEGGPNLRRVPPLYLYLYLLVCSCCMCVPVHRGICLHTQIYMYACAHACRQCQLSPSVALPLVLSVCLR